MSGFAIVTDSLSDLTPEFQEKYGIRLVSSHFTFPGKGEMTAFTSWDNMSEEEFYSELKKKPAEFTTSPATVEELAAVYEEYLSQGTDVLGIIISQSLSGSYGFAAKAAEQVNARHTDAKVYCLDTRRFGPAIGLMAVYASKLRAEGKTMDETVEWLEKEKNTFHQAGWLDDLSFVAKKGRMSVGKAVMGTLVGIKPLGEFDANGMTSIVGKVKGTKSAYDALLKYIEKTGENLADQTVFIAHSNRLEQALKYRDMIAEKFGPKEIFVCSVFPASGINVGPGLMAAYYKGRPISSDLSEEKAMMEEIIAKK